MNWDAATQCVPRCYHRTDHWCPRCHYSIFDMCAGKSDGVHNKMLSPTAPTWLCPQAKSMPLCSEVSQCSSLHI